MASPMKTIGTVLAGGRDAAIAVCYVMAFVLIVVSASVPALNPPDDVLDGGAGRMAPFLALSAGIVLLLNHLRNEKDLFEWWANLVAIGTFVVSSYFWLASNSNANPYSLELLRGMAVLTLALLIASATLIVSFGILWFSRDK